MLTLLCWPFDRRDLAPDAVDLQRLAVVGLVVDEPLLMLDESAELVREQVWEVPQPLVAALAVLHRVIEAL